MRRRTVIVWVVAATVLTLVTAACGSDGSSGEEASAGGTTIAVRDYEFDPGTLTVDVGDIVTWVWEGNAPHNVVGDGFTSPEQGAGTFRHTFDQPGTYSYECTIHPGMDGSVVVQEGT